MYADLTETEQMVEQTDIPVGRAARPDMTKNLRVLAGEISGAERGQGAGAHLGDRCRIENGDWHAGPWIKQIEERHFGR